MAKNEELIYTDEENGQMESKAKKLREKLKECQKQKEEYLSQAQRARADLINYRRRQEQVLAEFKKYSQLTFIRELLPIMDSLEIGAKDNKELALIKKQFQSILKHYGLKEIKALGKEFNPHYHEAVAMAESKNRSGTIIEEIQKGYLLADKVLRVSKVKVAK